MKKIILSIVITCLLLSGYMVQVEQVDANMNFFKGSSLPPTSKIRPIRQTLESNDEGPHNLENHTHQEWWYYIGVFNFEDSELKNWSMMASFNQMGALDMLFCTIFDDDNKTYGGVTNEWKGAMITSGPGVNVEFNGSYVVGSYPEWHVYAEFLRPNKENVTINVTYKALSLPNWLFFNSGRNKSDSKLGHYCIVESDINGTVTINETSYHVHGLGYHEHSWINIKNTGKINPLSSRKSSQDGVPNWQLLLDVWDWGSIFLDNGWNIFVAKICQQSPFSKILPGTLWITPDGENVTECSYFKFDYVETKNTSVPSLKIPTKVHIKAIFFNTILRNPLKGILRLDLYIEVTNMREFKWVSPNITAGVWEAPCKVHGTLKWFGNCVDLNGFCMLELTRAVRTE